MKRAILATAIAVAATVAVALPAAAWDVIGVTQVNGRMDRDLIDINSRERHHRVMLCAYQAPVRVDRVNIAYRNGGNQEVRLREVLAPGECSRAIDLQGRQRRIESIGVVFDQGRRGGWGDRDRYDGDRYDRRDRDRDRDWRRDPVVRIFAE